LLVDEGPDAIAVSGNRCPRGAVYAQEEVRSPKRMVTATCGICGNSVARRVPVKTSSPCPKEKIPELLADVYQATVNLPVKAGDTIIANWQNCGIDIVATRSIA
jgi:CxxC motif-containing protein